MQTPRILALIPAHNEAPRIAPVITGALAHLPVLVVDDGSGDETAALAEAQGAITLRQTPNQGKGIALRTGFHWAIDQNFEAVLTLDADGQHDPAEIPKFLEAYQVRHADLIIGARNFSQMPAVRRLANSLGRWSFSWAIGQPIRDNQSGYRLISRRLLDALLTSREQGFEFEVEMIVTCIRCGFSLDWVPISTIYAGESSHIHPLRHTQNFFRVVWQTRQSMRRAKPLKEN
ncbi:MAG: glycosyltransferase family 2 protein [Anaerolineae bacterium]|nr:glycosyltransferase family 2 protein [Anaerolineae bacterium]